jgi:hypothetical protein
MSQGREEPSGPKLYSVDGGDFVMHVLACFCMLFDGRIKLLHELDSLYEIIYCFIMLKHVFSLRFLYYVQFLWFSLNFIIFVQNIISYMGLFGLVVSRRKPVLSYRKAIVNFVMWKIVRYLIETTMVPTPFYIPTDVKHLSFCTDLPVWLMLCFLESESNIAYIRHTVV